MNIILISKRWDSGRQYRLTRPMLGTAAAILLILLGAVFYAGLRIGDGPASIDDGKWSQQIAQQRTEIEEAKREVQEKIGALASRVGQMNAHVIRLNALGKRITEMANLSKGEFNFEQEPAQGGPEVDIDAPAAGAPDLTNMLDGLLQQIQDRERQLSVLENLIATRNLSHQIVPNGRPVAEGWISSYFGGRSDPFTGHQAHHKGIDFAGPAGATVVSVAAGVVIWAGERSGYGQLVEINHGNGYITRYGHNEKLLVKAGDKVEKGQTVSLLGSTGRSTGPHLHFEVLKNGVAVNPLRFVRRQDKPLQVTAPLKEAS